MEQRLNFYKASPNATKALMVLETALHKLSIEPLVVDLVKLRASQINGCAYSVDTFLPAGSFERDWAGCTPSSVSTGSPTTVGACPSNLA